MIRRIALQLNLIELMHYYLKSELEDSTSNNEFKRPITQLVD